MTHVWQVTIKDNVVIEVADTDFVLAMIETGGVVSLRPVRKEKSPARGRG